MPGHMIIASLLAIKRWRIIHREPGQPTIRLLPRPSLPALTSQTDVMAGIRDGAVVSKGKGGHHPLGQRQQEAELSHKQRLLEGQGQRLLCQLGCGGPLRCRGREGAARQACRQASVLLKCCP